MCSFQWCWDSNSISHDWLVNFLNCWVIFSVPQVLPVNVFLVVISPFPFPQKPHLDVISRLKSIVCFSTLSYEWTVHPWMRRMAFAIALIVSSSSPASSSSSSWYWSWLSTTGDVKKQQIGTCCSTGLKEEKGSYWLQQNGRSEGKEKEWMKVVRKLQTYIIITIQHIVDDEKRICLSLAIFHWKILNEVYL